ncbi:ATP-dependent DNA helicase UvrD2 [Nocardioides marmotae]|uniref:DNA 3'-5' helicase n=1 Tax=Nocardioides marmotae TaxID=2663857 RepID=A0A6I3J3E8_9ACTN|nr:ATP-dependent DNA helicase UvrD2 [Nocardioides marmotae]MCR6031517.1 AAA family ATPase [Gordonia jinghuaiqii]MBC9733327.1 ATP-dependent DNA helicase UvrD2 [Nocardioides marmotae]MTB84434.1 AAA family ATPase [Nocardioides marmotae]MTB95156.1 AAA family ATPase [Nocardioides marmotae]QKE02358.1 ATP-dependent DNA helicase UvrD2 [Nocardioides marmotae]
MTRPEDLLAALDPEQRTVAEALRGPVRVLAGAGTGKTRAITHRIAYGVATGVYAPTEVLAVTFTTRAAGEMRGRLRTLGAGGVQARTFHSAALRQLRYFWPHVHGTELPQLIESKIGLLASAARRQRISADQALLRDLASEVEWAKVSNVHPDDYARVAPERGRSVTNLDPGTVGRVFGSYEDAKREAGRMDMEDILLLTAGMLAEDERVAAQVRRQYKWFVVDEFQDVSPLQSALLDLWLGGRNEICVVGDPAQTIYSFAGANADYLRDFPKRHPGTTSVELVRNYRSTPQVVEAANTLLAGTPSQGVDLRAQRPAGPPVTYQARPDEVAEAEEVAARILKLRDAGRPLGEIAILFRINALSEAFEEALSARRIPYVVRGASRFFDRPEVREAVTRIRGAARSGEGVGVVDTVTATLAGMGWTAEAPAARGQTRDRWESWQALVDQASEFESGGGDLEAFVDDLDRRAAEQHAPVAEGVTLATFHAAKGLEWDSVFLCGLQDGTLPITYADTPLAVEEERRLLYVGMTRARLDLALSWAAARNPGGRASRRPSRFLDPLLPEDTRPQDGPRRRKVAGCRECGKPLTSAVEKKRGRCHDCPASYDEELFERLRTWRKERADTESVPAFVVFTDATLQLIAEHKPRTPEAMLRISGIGRSKVEKYGEDVLELVG